MSGRVLLVLLLALPAPAATADPPVPPAAPAPQPPTLAQAVAAVVEALAVKDDVALRAAAAREVPDPWLVADELLRRGERETAAAFAAAAAGEGSPRKDREALPRWVAAAGPDDAAQRALLERVATALAARDHAGVLAALGPAAAGIRRDVVAIRLAHARGLALLALERRTEGRAALLAAADEAAALGWLRRASNLFGESGRAAADDDDPAAALTVWERLLPFEELRGYDHGIARTLTDMAVAHLAREQFREARERLTRALPIMDRLRDRASQAAILLNLGNAQKGLRDYGAALTAHRSALALFEGLGEADGAAKALNGLCGTHRALGNYALALASGERALAAYEGLGDRRGLTRALGNLALLHGDLGDHGTALDIQRRVLAVQEALRDRPGTALTLGNLGAELALLGEHDEARAAFERSREAHEALGNPAAAARMRGNVGNLDLAAGRPTEALATYEGALAEIEARGDRAASLWMRLQISRAQAALGRREAATETLEGAVRAARSLRATPLLLAGLGDLAEAHLAAGDAQRARAAAGEAIREFEGLFVGLADVQGAEARASHAGVFAVGATAALRLGDAHDAFQFLEAGRAGAFLEGLRSRQAQQWALMPAAYRLEEADARARAAAAQAALAEARRGGGAAALEARAKDLDEARARLRAAGERLERWVKAETVAFYPRPAPVEQVQACLAPDQALVSYGLGRPEAFAVVVSREAVRLVALGTSAEVRAEIERLPSAEPGLAWEPSVGTLARLLVEPLALPPAARHVLLCPEGTLARVPFALLLPDRTVSHVASGSALLLALEAPASRGAGTLALGDPDYLARREPAAGRVHAPLGRGGRLRPLPATRAEAEAVGTRLLLGADATEAGLAAALADAGRWRSIHFACHGLVNREQPALSALALSPDRENDGFLTALEVLALGMPTDLAVLSACESAQGKDVPAEGVLGLARTFTLAGASRVLCSLWKVDDAATAALMTKFYALWNPRAQPGDPEPAQRAEGPKHGTPGLPAAEALREAQAFVRAQEKWAHPYYWAAWVLWGVP